MAKNTGSKTPRRATKDGAKEVLRQNLQQIMAVHPILNNRKAVSLRTGGEVSARAVGYMLQEDGGNPTLAHLEAVAGIYHLEVWELLMPGLDTSKVVGSVTVRERALHKRIEDSMKALGISEYRVKSGARPAKRVPPKQHPYGQPYDVSE